MANERPVLRTFPRADRGFQLEVERVFTEWVAGAGDEADPREFERLVRTSFPSATVRPQDALASLGPPQVIWYVYRREAGPTPAGDPTAAAAAPGTTPTYSAARVAEMVGLPMSVLVAWDERDGIVRPARTPAGLPLYSRDDVEALIIAKKQVAAGKSTEQVRAALEARRGAWLARHDQPAERSRRLLVLLAERDRYAAEFSEYFLRTEGYEVEVALSAAEAEARAAELQPDVAVVELLISGGSGAELCARLKSRPGAVVLAISSLDAGDMALRAGADAFLAKPYDPLAFVSVIKDLLGESAMLRRAGSLSTDGAA